MVAGGKTVDLPQIGGPLGVPDRDVKVKAADARQTLGLDQLRVTLLERRFDPDVFADIPKRHDCADERAVLANRCARVLDVNPRAILPPEHFTDSHTERAESGGGVDRTLLERVGRAI